MTINFTAATTVDSDHNGAYLLVVFPGGYKVNTAVNQYPFFGGSFSDDCSNYNYNAANNGYCVDSTKSRFHVYKGSLLPKFTSGQSYTITIPTVIVPLTGGVSGNFQIVTQSAGELSPLTYQYIKRDVDFDDSVPGPYIYGYMNSSQTAIGFSSVTAGLPTTANISFRYSQALAIGENVTFRQRPVSESNESTWDTTGAVITSSSNGCGLVAHGGAGPSFSLQVSHTNLARNTLCHVEVGGLTNPSAAGVHEADVLVAIATDGMSLAPFSLGQTTFIERGTFDPNVTTLRLDENTQQLVSDVTFTFQYSKALAVNDVVTLALPGWTVDPGSAIVVSSSFCNGTNATFEHEASSSSAPRYTFGVRTWSIPSNESCRFTITGLANPSTTASANNVSYTVAITAAAGSSGDVAIPYSDAIIELGVLGTTHVRLVNRVVDNPSEVVVSFTYSKVLAPGDKVRLSLPYFAVHDSVSVSGVAANGTLRDGDNIAIAAKGTNASASFYLLLTIDSTPFNGGETVAINVTGLRNPANSTDALGATVAITAVAGSIGVTAIMTEPRIVPATFIVQAVDMERLGGTRMKVKLISTGSGPARCVVVANGTSQAPDASDIIDGHAYGNAIPVANSSVVSLGADVAAFLTVTGLSASTTYDVYCTQRFVKLADYPTTGEIEFTTAVANSVATRTAMVTSNTTAFVVRAVFATTGMARCIALTADAAAPLNATSVMAGGGDLPNVVGSPPSAALATSGEYFVVAYAVGVLSNVATYDVYCAQAGSPVSNTTVTVTPGSFGAASVALTERTQSLLTLLVYTFAYNYDIATGENIVLYLPYWAPSTDGTPLRATDCHSIAWTVAMGGEAGASNFTLSLSGNATLAKSTECSVEISTLRNPNDVTESPGIKQSIVAAAGSVGVHPVSTVPSVLQAGTMSYGLSAISVDNTLPGSDNVNMTYTFRYSKNLTVGDSIVLALSDWAGTALSVDNSTECAAQWTVSSSGASKSYAMTLVVAEGVVGAQSTCAIVVRGLNSLPVTPANHQNFTHTVTASAGSMASTAIGVVTPVTALTSVTFFTETVDLELTFVAGQLTGQRIVVGNGIGKLDLNASFASAATLHGRTNKSGTTSVNMTSGVKEDGDGHFELNPGENKLFLTIGGAVQKESYTITVVRALLTSINVNDEEGNDLGLAFVSGKMSGMSMLLSSAIHYINVTRGAASSMAMNEGAFSTGSGPLTLHIGLNTLYVKVDGPNEGTYTIAVRRAAVASLNFVTISTSPFVSGTLSTGTPTHVPEYITSLNMTAVFYLGTVNATLNAGSEVAVLNNTSIKIENLVHGYNTLAMVSSEDGEYVMELYRGVISDATVTLGASVPNATTNVNITFTSHHIIPSDGVLAIAFPAGFGLVNATVQSAVGSGNHSGTFDINVVGNTVSIGRSGNGSEWDASTVSLVLGTIKNPVVLYNGSFGLNTTTSTGALIGRLASFGAVTIE